MKMNKKKIKWIEQNIFFIHHKLMLHDLGESHGIHSQQQCIGTRPMTCHIVHIAHLTTGASKSTRTSYQIHKNKWMWIDPVYERTIGYFEQPTSTRSIVLVTHFATRRIPVIGISLARWPVMGTRHIVNTNYTKQNLPELSSQQNEGAIFSRTSSMSHSFNDNIKDPIYLHMT